MTRNAVIVTGFLHKTQAGVIWHRNAQEYYPVLHGQRKGSQRLTATQTSQGRKEDPSAPPSGHTGNRCPTWIRLGLGLEIKRIELQWLIPSDWTKPCRLDTLLHSILSYRILGYEWVHLNTVYSNAVLFHVECISALINYNLFRNIRNSLLLTWISDISDK